MILDEGWRGPIAKFTKKKDLEDQLKNLKKPPGLLKKFLVLLQKYQMNMLMYLQKKTGLSNLKRIKSQ